MDTPEHGQTRLREGCKGGWFTAKCSRDLQVSAARLVETSGVGGPRGAGVGGQVYKLPANITALVSVRLGARGCKTGSGCCSTDVSSDSPATLAA